MQDSENNVRRAKRAFDKITASSYYGVEFIYHLARNQRALDHLENLIKELRGSVLLAEVMDNIDEEV